MHAQVSEDELKRQKIHKINKIGEIRVVNAACSILRPNCCTSSHHLSQQNSMMSFVAVRSSSLWGPKDDTGEGVRKLAGTTEHPMMKQSRMSLAACRWNLTSIFQTIIRNYN